MKILEEKANVGMYIIPLSLDSSNLYWLAWGFEAQ